VSAFSVRGSDFRDGKFVEVTSVDTTPSSSEPRPAATVVVLRESGTGSEVLLVQRAKRDGTGGIWVFPGGKIEAVDRHGPEGPESATIEAAKRAGVRETQEEAGFLLEPASLGLIARWITPPVSPRRFDTWFFIAEVDRQVQVEVDGGEICAHRWLSPRAALDARIAGEIGLAPPTLVTIHWLAEYAGVNETLAGLVREAVPKYEPNICPIEGGACILYPGDAGYQAGAPELAGGRNRLWSVDGTLRYERSA
jgi:8-oxo-dGTP pyrophosphatase MutT (NUDIX family)